MGSVFTHYCRRVGCRKRQHCHCLVEGYCRGLPARHVQVQCNVGDCIIETTPNAGDCRTGWRSTSRSIVEEINIEDDSEKIV
ncbi:hypothetical protein LSAT2_000274 [Lamellibrachia satsuma]|nr:hypothetical protein LSAT2_000274 [Lamellibrachia satsuma]